MWLSGDENPRPPFGPRRWRVRRSSWYPGRFYSDYYDSSKAFKVSVKFNLVLTEYIKSLNFMVTDFVNGVVSQNETCRVFLMYENIVKTFLQFIKESRQADGIAVRN